MLQFYFTMPDYFDDIWRIVLVSFIAFLLILLIQKLS